MTESDDRFSSGGWIWFAVHYVEGNGKLTLKKLSSLQCMFECLNN